MATLKRWKRLMNPNYIGAYILEPNQELTLTIDRVIAEEIKGEKGRTDIKPVCYFKENYKPMILNNTNCSTIEFLTGSDLPDDWAGHKITIYAEPTTYNKQTVEALRIRTTKPQKTKEEIESEEINRMRNSIAKAVGNQKELFESACIDICGITGLKQLNTDNEAVKHVYNNLRGIQAEVRKVLG